ncbi:MAG TPA: hypothetical protein VFE27_03670 [Acidobacteriaceae bacterium]|nr:hypothetical protein [Acidobacteriaceae bacterium]
MHSVLVQDPRWSLVLRVASSRNFKSSPRLRDLLLYVAECAIRDTPEDATEQQIGIKVFGRPAGYNSSEDSIVRSHARLLRQKLTAYFETDGADEELRIDVPKGHYLLVFRSRASAVIPPVPVIVPKPKIEPVDLDVAQDAPAHTTSYEANKSRKWLLWIGIGFVAGVLFALAVVLLSGTRVNRSVAALWRPFLTGDPPLLIYSNGVFVGDSKNGMRYATLQEAQNPPADGHLIDHYTGIGEAAGVYELTRLFDSAHATFILKRSHLVTWDEAKQRNLIFIGSPAENLAVQALPSNAEFTLFSSPEASGYHNNHPRPGELANYVRPEHPLNRDYAIISFLPGMQSGKKIMWLSGLTTLGTQAAVEFASRPDGAAELLKTARGPDGKVRPFEALLETTIIGGVPLEVRLVTIHVH